MPPRIDKRLAPVPAEIRDYVGQLVREHGAAEAARRLRMGRGTVLGIAAGLDCMPGSIAMVKVYRGTEAPTANP